MRVVVDPGHNAFGPDTGAEGNGLKEQDITLDIGLKLKPLLIQNGFEVIMTREGPTVGGSLSSVISSLAARCTIANNAKADLFVAIHVNAGGGTGTEVWIVARGGNAERAAGAVLGRLVSAGGWANRGVKTAKDYVLKYTDMPAILTENGFIDNPADATKLADPNFRQSLAVAHARGICDYFGIQYKEANIVAETKPATPVPDPDVYIVARVRTSKVDALIAHIIKDWECATKKLELP